MNCLLCEKQISANDAVQKSYCSIKCTLMIRKLKTEPKQVAEEVLQVVDDTIKHPDQEDERIEIDGVLQAKCVQL